MTPNNDFRDKISESFKKMKALGIIASIIMVLLGACTVISPFGTGMVWLIIAFIAIFINGIANIVEFCKMPKGAKNGGTLALGILWIVIAALFLFGRADIIPITEEVLLFVLGFMFGFNCIFSGIMEIASMNMYANSGLAVLSGILYILIGLLVITAPFVAGVTLLWLVGILTIVAGVSLFVKCLSF